MSINPVSPEPGGDGPDRPSLRIDHALPQSEKDHLTGVSRNVQKAFTDPKLRARLETWGYKFQSETNDPKNFTLTDFSGSFQLSVEPNTDPRFPSIPTETHLSIRPSTGVPESPTIQADRTKKWLDQLQRSLASSPVDPNEPVGRAKVQQMRADLNNTLNAQRASVGLEPRDPNAPPMVPRTR